MKRQTRVMMFVYFFYPFESLLESRSMCKLTKLEAFKNVFSSTFNVSIWTVIIMLIRLHIIFSLIKSDWWMCLPSSYVWNELWKVLSPVQPKSIPSRNADWNQSMWEMRGRNHIIYEILCYVLWHKIHFQCNGHATECYYNPEVDQRGLSINTEGIASGGGVCLNCSVSYHSPIELKLYSLTWQLHRISQLE